MWLGSRTSTLTCRQWCHSYLHPAPQIMMPINSEALVGRLRLLRAVFLRHKATRLVLVLLGRVGHQPLQFSAFWWRHHTSSHSPDSPASTRGHTMSRSAHSSPPFSCGRRSHWPGTRAPAFAAAFTDTKPLKEQFRPWFTSFEREATASGVVSGRQRKHSPCIAVFCFGLSLHLCPWMVLV